MRVLFVGTEGYENIVPGLIRLGHQVVSIDPLDALPNLPKRLADAWVWKAGGLGLVRRVERHVLSSIGDATFDIAIVLRGELVGPGLVQKLPAPRRVNFNNDHPFGRRDGNRWRVFKRALPHYDLFVAPREVTLDAATKGQKRLKVFLWADEVMHRPLDRADIPTHLQSDVAFVGTWMPERGPFMLRLIERGVPLTIFGQGWNKAPEYPALSSHIRLGSLSPQDYVRAVSGCRIALALLSKGNEDLHTRRSNEIPALGRLLSGERTSDHVVMYREGEEAIFWSSADECADQCLSLLNDDFELDSIAAAGHNRCVANGYFTEPTLKRVIDVALEG